MPSESGFFKERGKNAPHKHSPECPESLTEKEGTRVLIEPTSRVVNTLRLAVGEVGPSELLRHHDYSLDLLEKWTNGQAWIPLDLVKEACEINRRNSESPSYSKVLSECTSGAHFRIAGEKEIEKAGPFVAGETAQPEAKTKIEPREKPILHTAGVQRPGARTQIAKVTIVLFIFPLLGATVGFFVLGDARGAIMGTLASYAIAIALAFVILLPRKLRGSP